MSHSVDTYAVSFTLPPFQFRHDLLDPRPHTVLDHRLFKRFGFNLVLGGQDGASMRLLEHAHDVGCGRLVLHLLLLPLFKMISSNYISRGAYMRPAGTARPQGPAGQARRPSAASPPSNPSRWAVA